MGACRIPDPTTAGDFLRRFKSAQNLEGLSGAIDDIEQAVWSKLPATVRRRRKKYELALVDLDGHIKPLYGVQKEGADFSYDGRWSYQPLVVSLGGSGECLKVVNQPGSARSSEAAAGALREVLPRVKRHFKNAIVRGDTDYDRADVYQAVIEQGAYFAIGGECMGTGLPWRSGFRRSDGSVFIRALSASPPAGLVARGAHRTTVKAKPNSEGIAR